MTARSRRLLAALEDGCETRDQIFAHQGRFSLLNNAAAELRASGISVSCELVDGDYHYFLLDDRVAATPSVAPIVEQELAGSVQGERGCVRGDSSPEEPSPANPGAPEQLSFAVAA